MGCGNGLDVRNVGDRGENPGQNSSDSIQPGLSHDVCFDPR